MRVRIAVTTAYGLLLGLWAYAEQKQIDAYSQGTYEFLHSTGFRVVFALALPLVVGVVVGRWWVLASLLGPLAVLTYLQISGYVSPWHDGVPPLGLISLISLFVSAVPLAIGASLGAGLSHLQATRSPRA